MGDALGLTEALSIALGGMIGGGIYAVLGVVVGIAGPAVWFGFVLAGVGALAISLSALVSTGSAINATLFSAGHFAEAMVTEELLPDRLGDPDAAGVPSRTLGVLAALTGLLTVVGGLGAITAFASLAFIVVFGTVSAIAFAHRDAAGVHPVPPAVGVLGTAAFLPLMAWHLYATEPETFLSVLALVVAVLVAELAYFERDVIEEEVVPFAFEG